MENIQDTTNIKELNIPGAHNASTKFCNFLLISKCQSLSIYELLNIGVRVLDLRVNGEDVVHSFVKCKKSYFFKTLKIYDVVSDIYKFLEKNPTETVIIVFKNDGRVSGNECFNILKEKIISKNSEKWFLKNEFPIISQVRGKIILINRANEMSGINFSNMPYQSKFLTSSLKEFSNDGINKVTVQDFYLLRRKTKWLKSIKPILDKENSYKNRFVFNCFSTAAFPFIPFFNSVYINRKFLNYNLKNKGHYGVLMFDFQNIEITQKIIKSNFKN